MRLVFAGTPEFAERALAALDAAGHEIALVLTQPDRPAGRGLRPTAAPVKRYAAAHGIEVYQPPALKAPEALVRIAAEHPEVLVVAAYGVLLPQRLLDAAPQGALNIHASLLPRWRGAAPIQRALLAGDRETGVSIMQLDAGLDTGPVLAQQRTPIAADDDAGTLRDRLAALGSEMIVAALAELAAGRARAVPQPVEGVTYAPKIAKTETRLDWSRSAAELERAVRAFRPSPGAWTKLEGEPIKLWRAQINPGRGAPGTVLSQEPLTVACGDAALTLIELQRAGGRKLTAGEFIRGRALAAGMRFE